MEVQSALLFESTEEIYARVFAELKPRTKPPEIAVEFRPFANANCFIRLENGRLHVRISDILQSAPAPIVEALAHILLCKLFRRPIPAIYNHRYRLYLNRREVRRSAELLRQIRGYKFISGPQGERYNLEEIFEDLNQRYFDGLMARPPLGWSRRPSRCTLGHYDPSHNAIVISKLLDQEEIPLLALEYVLFHEMLHLRYPVEHKGARRRIHTRAFREAEKAFERLKESKEMLRRL
jgi:hypothetical protein